MKPLPPPGGLRVLEHMVRCRKFGSVEKLSLVFAIHRQIPVSLFFPKVQLIADFLAPSMPHPRGRCVYRQFGFYPPMTCHLHKVGQSLPYPHRNFRNAYGKLFDLRTIRPMFGNDRLCKTATNSLTASTSASVSLTKWLIATTTGTPNDFRFSM